MIRAARIGVVAVLAVLLPMLAACDSTPLPPASPSVILPSPTTGQPTPSSNAPQVMLLVLENNDYENVIGNPDAPSLNALAHRYGLATHSYARRHPSLPNYLELVAGSTFGIHDDCTDCSIDAPTIVDQLSSRGFDWAAYMEDMPSPCFTGGGSGDYAKKHDPLMYVDHLRNQPAQCAKIQPLSGFDPRLDSGTLPAFVEITPNMCHDGHDCSLRQSDRWVGGFTSRVLGSSWFARGGVLIITYDEGSRAAGCCRDADGGHVATMVVSKSTPAGSRMETPITHAGVLRTIEELYGLPFLGEATCACSGDLRPLLG